MCKITKSLLCLIMFYQYLTTDIKSSKTKKIEFSNDIFDTPGIVSAMSSVDSGVSFFSFFRGFHFGVVCVGEGVTYLRSVVRICAIPEADEKSVTALAIPFILAVKSPPTLNMYSNFCISALCFVSCLYNIKKMMI